MKSVGKPNCLQLLGYHQIITRPLECQETLKHITSMYLLSIRSYMCLKFQSEISILWASNLLIPQSTENEHLIKLENNISETNDIPNDFPQMY